jgi:hypothetical protein
MADIPESVHFPRERALLLRLADELTSIKKRLSERQSDPYRLSLRYAKRMVLIGQILAGTWAFCTRFAHVLDEGIASKELAHGQRKWTPGGWLRRAIALGLPSDAQPQSRLAATIVSAFVDSWEHGFWFWLAAWLIWNESWSSVEGDTSAFASWFAVLGLEVTN